MSPRLAHPSDRPGRREIDVGHRARLEARSLGGGLRPARPVGRSTDADLCWRPSSHVAGWAFQGLATDQCLEAARRFYAGRAFVDVTDKPPQTKWATGSNLAFVSYAADPERNLVIAIGVVDNLGKGAGQAVQNANLICLLPEAAGLGGVPV